MLGWLFVCFFACLFFFGLSPLLHFSCFLVLGRSETETRRLLGTWSSESGTTFRPWKSNARQSPHQACEITRWSAFETGKDLWSRMGYLDGKLLRFWSFVVVFSCWNRSKRRFAWWKTCFFLFDGHSKKIECMFSRLASNDLFGLTFFSPTSFEVWKEKHWNWRELQPRFFVLFFSGWLLERSGFTLSHYGPKTAANIAFRGFSARNYQFTLWKLVVKRERCLACGALKLGPLLMKFSIKPPKIRHLFPALVVGYL